MYIYNSLDDAFKQYERYKKLPFFLNSILTVPNQDNAIIAQWRSLSAYKQTKCDYIQHKQCGTYKTKRNINKCESSVVIHKVVELTERVSMSWDQLQLTRSLGRHFEQPQDRRTNQGVEVRDVKIPEWFVAGPTAPETSSSSFEDFHMVQDRLYGHKVQRSDSSDRNRRIKSFIYGRIQLFSPTYTWVMQRRSNERKQSRDWRTCYSLEGLRDQQR